MTDKLRQAAQQMLEAATDLTILTPREWQAVHGLKIDALREALAEQPAEQQRQEPVAWMCSNTKLLHKGYQMFSATRGGDWNIPVYTAPQPRRRLTDEEIDNTTRKQVDDLLDHIYEYGTAAEGIDYRLRAIARAIERAHGIGVQV